LIIGVWIFTLDVVRMVLIDRIVAEVHTRVPQIHARVVILDGCKPYKALLVEIDDKRVIRGDEDIEAEV
jgi:hypothetical protein